VSVFRLQDLALVRTLDAHRARLWSVRFSPDGTQLATGAEDRSIHLWRWPEGSLERSLVLTDPQAVGIVSALRYSPDGTRLASLHGRNASVALWDPRDGRQLGLLSGHQGFGASLAFSPDGRWLASGGIDRSVRLWEVSSGACVQVLRHPAYVTELAFAPDGALLTGCFDGTLRSWEPRSGTLQAELHAQPDSIDGLDIQPGGRLVATASQDGSVHVWRSLGDLSDRPAQGHTDHVMAAAFSPDGRAIASAGQDGRILIRDAASGALTRVLEGHTAMVTSLDFSPDGARLASGSWDHTAVVWDLATGARTLLQAPEYGPAASVRFHPDGLRLAVGYINTPLVLWELPARRDRRLAPGHINQVVDVAFDARGERLASASRDLTLRLWRLGSDAPPQVLHTETPNNAVAWFPRGDRLASVGEDGALRLWDAAGGAGTSVSRVPARALSLAIDPAGDRLAVGYADGTVRLWDREGRELVPPMRHRSEVNAVRFDPAGQRLVSAGDDDTVRLWDAASGRPLWATHLLLRDPPRVLDHRGWFRLTPRGDEPEPAPATRWAAAVGQEARQADLAPEGDRLCLAGHDGAVELWATDRDERLARQELGEVRDLLATPEGCLVRTDARAVWLAPGAAPRVLAQEVTAIARDRAELLMACGGEVLVFSEGGDLRATLPGSRGATALARSGGRLILGHAHGGVQVLAQPGGREAATFSLVDTPASQVMRLLPGPMSTVVIGFADGQLGVWDLHDGARLTSARLHGAVDELLFSGPELLAASELGDHTRLDLGVFDLDRCGLMRQVWREVPSVWQNGRARLRAPPAGHACLAALARPGVEAAPRASARPE
jgi:WD40 repeat protein